VLKTGERRDRDTLTSLSRACSDHRAVELDYASWPRKSAGRSASTPRPAQSPGHLVCAGKSLSDKEGRILIFRAERILGATVLDETFTVPADFNLRDYMGDRMFITDAKPTQIVLRLREPAAARLRPGSSSRSACATAQSR